MQVAVIGSSGFLGSMLFREFLDSGHQVLGFDLRPPALVPTGGRFTVFNCTEDTLSFPPGLDAVFYLAQSSHYRDFPDSAVDLFEVNVLGLAKAAAAARAAGVKFFCHASTGNVYLPSFEPLAESHPVNRANAYALSKLMAEEVLDLFSGCMTTVSARFFGIFGPGQQAMLPAFLYKAILSGHPITLSPSPDDPSGRDGLKISFGYGLDVCRILKQLIEAGLAGGPLPPRLNVAGPRAVSLRHFAELIGQTVGRSPIFETGQESRTFNLIADLGLLRSLLDPVFTPLEQAVAASYGSEGAAPA